MVALLYDDLDMGRRCGEGEDVGVDVGAGAGRRGPLVAVLEHELADWRQIGGVAVCRTGAERRSEQAAHGVGASGGV